MWRGLHRMKHLVRARHVTVPVRKGVKPEEGSDRKPLITLSFSSTLTGTVWKETCARISAPWRAEQQGFIEERSAFGQRKQELLSCEETRTAVHRFTESVTLSAREAKCRRVLCRLRPPVSERDLVTTIKLAKSVALMFLQRC